MQFDLPTSSNTLTNFMGSIFLLSLLGGFISDTYLNRFYTLMLFGSLEVIVSSNMQISKRENDSFVLNIYRLICVFLRTQGLSMVTIQAYSKDLHPDPCGKSSCVKGGIAWMFYGSLILLALGAGGVKGALPALGADQFDSKDKNGDKIVASYFNWYLLSTTLGGMFGVTVIVWVSMNRDWYWGFFICTITAIVGYIAVALGKPFYRFQPLGNSPFLKIGQVIFFTNCYTIFQALKSIYFELVKIVYMGVSGYSCCNPE